MKIFREHLRFWFHQKIVGSVVPIKEQYRESCHFMWLKAFSSVLVFTRYLHTIRDISSCYRLEMWRMPMWITRAEVWCTLATGMTWSMLSASWTAPSFRTVTIVLPFKWDIYAYDNLMNAERFDYVFWCKKMRSVAHPNIKTTWGFFKMLISTRGKNDILT